MQRHARVLQNQNHLALCLCFLCFFFLSECVWECRGRFASSSLLSDEELSLFLSFFFFFSFFAFFSCRKMSINLPVRVGNYCRIWQQVSMVAQRHAGNLSSGAIILASKGCVCTFLRFWGSDWVFWLLVGGSSSSSGTKLYCSPAWEKQSFAKWPYMQTWIHVVIQKLNTVITGVQGLNVQSANEDSWSWHSVWLCMKSN